MIYRRKKDAVHDEVRDALRAAGWTVIETYRHPGLLDMLAARDRVVVWVEAKSHHGSLTDAESRLIDSWPGYVIVARSADDALSQARRILREQRYIENVGVIHP